MANILPIPIVAADGQTYSIACDASGGSGPGTPGGGLLQLTGPMARYALLLTSGSGIGPTTWLPDGTHQAVRAVAIINSSATPQVVTLTLFDASAGGTTNQIFEMVLPGGGVPIMLNYPLSHGLTWELSDVLTANIAILGN